MARTYYVVLLVGILPILPGQTDDAARALYESRAGVTRSNWDEGGDRSRWVYLHPSEVFPAAVLHRAAPEQPSPFICAPRSGTSKSIRPATTPSPPGCHRRP